MMIKEYWIRQLQEIPDFKELASTEDVELGLIKAYISKDLKNHFIETSNEEGIAHFEQMLKVQPRSEDTLKDRKTRVRRNWNIVRPYTLRSLEDKIIELVGTNGYEIQEDFDNYTMLVEINLGKKSQLQETKKLIQLMAPANINLTIALRYNRHSDLGVYTYAQLALKTHNELREEELI